MSAEDSDTESMILPPIQKPGAANLAPTTSLGEENSEDETLAAAEKKKVPTFVPCIMLGILSQAEGPLLLKTN